MSREGKTFTIAIAKSAKEYRGFTRGATRGLGRELRQGARYKQEGKGRGLGGYVYLDDAWMRGAIDFTKKSLGVNKEIPASQVFDFSFVEKTLGEKKADSHRG